MGSRGPEDHPVVATSHPDQRVLADRRPVEVRHRDVQPGAQVAGGHAHAQENEAEVEGGDGRPGRHGHQK